MMHGPQNVKQKNVNFFSYFLPPAPSDDLLKLSRQKLKMVTAIYTGHAPVRGHLYIMGLFDGDPVCRFRGMEAETVQHIICCCEA